MTLTILFWCLLLVLFYTYVGYGLLLWCLVKLKKILFPGKVAEFKDDYEPDVCLFVTAFNESDYIGQKVSNAFELDYPKDKIQYLWITDGSDDGTPEMLKQYENLEVYHQAERRGKMHAMNRGMKFVKVPIVIFSDSNTILGKQSIREIVRQFSNPKIGCVAGDSATGAGCAEIMPATADSDRRPRCRYWVSGWSFTCYRRHCIRPK